jgi:hypothetical protein
MSAADTLVGVVLLLGNQARDGLVRAMEKERQSDEVRQLVEEAHETLTVLIQHAQDGQAEIDGSSDAQGA